MPKTILDFGRLTRVHEQAAQRLTRLGNAVPQQAQPAQPFDAYLAQAQQRAASDPVFKQDLERALAQYRVVGGK
jgi:hypothetical protein